MTFRRAGLGVTSSVLSDGSKEYTPGVSSREGNVSTFQHSGLKNALDQTDSSEIVTASRHYDAFGNVIDSSGTWEGPFGYAGGFGYLEDGNGLKLLGHRYYDSDIGRFVTSDPIGSGRNWYVYVGGRPVSDADPSGLSGLGGAIAGVFNSLGKIPFLQRYGTEEEAAIAALDWIWDKSVDVDLEYAGHILEEDLGDTKRYRPTPPTPGPSAYRGRLARSNTGREVGIYHTHPGPGKGDLARGTGINSGDKEAAIRHSNYRKRRIRSYVLGWTYIVQRYDPVRDIVENVGKITRGDR